MTRRYFRQFGGRFRGARLADFGMACCMKCGAIHTPDPEEARDGSFIDPRKLREIQMRCVACRGVGVLPEATMFAADGAPPCYEEGVNG